VAYNIDMATALKVSIPDNRSKTVDFPSNAAQMPNSFRDSMKEAVSSRSLDERKTDGDTALRKELVSKSEAKLKNLKKPEVKSKENEKPEEGNEKQIDTIVKTIEEMLSKLEELVKLQQPGEVPTEKQTALQDDIMKAIKELPAVQGSSKGIETAELQVKTPELTDVLKGMLEELKTNDSLMNKTLTSDFAQELEIIISETVAKIEASKTPTENNVSEPVQIKADNSTDKAAASLGAVSSEVDKAHAVQSEEKNNNSAAESKMVNDAEEKQNQQMKVEVPVADTKPVIKEAKPVAVEEEEVEVEVEEQVKTTIDSKVDKVTVEGKESKKQDTDTESSNGAEHQMPKTINAAHNKQGNAEMAAMKLDQAVVDNQVEIVQNQVTAPKSETVNKTDIINQIVKKAEVIFTDAKQEMRMQLEPENLGKLSLKLAVEKGLITAKFVAESYEVKQIIESNLNDLKDMLKEKGLEVQNFSVSVGQDNKEQNNDNAFHQWKETVKLNGRSMNKGSYEGYQTGEVAPARIVNPYSMHNGKFDHRA